MAYSWQVRCIDFSGNSRYSNPGDFIFDNGNMTFTSLTPGNNIYVKTAQNFSVNLTSAAPLQLVNWFVNGVLQNTYTVVETTTKLRRN